MPKINRRAFLKSAAVASAITIIPRHVLGQGQTPPSEKINIAGIGTGQGRHDIDQMRSQNIVAICDIDTSHAADTLKTYSPARHFKDYRKMLDQMKEIDAVIVAVPDQMHAMISMDAIRHGKHVYCEKPLTHDVWESRQLAAVAHQAKVATQMGNQGQASTETRMLEELVWTGVVGPIHEAHIWTDRPSQGLFNEYWPQGVNRPKDTPPVPANIDWDLWIGGAPMRPYNPAYHPFKWRGWWDFGTGALGDMGCHLMDPVFRALKLGHPTHVQAASTRVNTETYPLGSMVTYFFPARDAQPQATNVHARGLSGVQAGGTAMPPLKLTWYDGGLRPPRPEGLPEGAMMGDNGRLLVGEKGFILGNKIFPESLREGFTGKPKFLHSSPGHYTEFMEACKGRGTPGANFDWAGPLTEVVLLGNVALRSQLRTQLTEHKLAWDPTALAFTNLPEANQFLRREYRQGWAL